MALTNIKKFFGVEGDGEAVCWCRRRVLSGRT